MSQPFRIGITRDFLRADGTLGFGAMPLDLLERVPGAEWEFLAEDRRELGPDQVRGYDALIVLTPLVTAATLAGADRLTHLARFGVGYDSVDVGACTERGVVLTITPDAVRRPVASSVLAFILALSLKLFAKDRITRAGRWGDKLDYMGLGLAGRTLGVVGLGNIGRDVFTLAAPLGMRHIAYDPYLSPERAPAGVELTDLETLLREADFVSLNCNLTPETRGLIDAERLALMQPSAYLINTARGPVVDQAALTAALREGRIACAALDVFEREPIDPADPLLTLDNVIVTPHAIAWTDEWIATSVRVISDAILAVASGRVPQGVVNREVLEAPPLREKLRRYAERAASLRGQGAGVVNGGGR